MNQRIKLIKRFFEQNPKLFKNFYNAFIKQNGHQCRKKDFVKYCQKYVCDSEIMKLLFLSAFTWNETEEGCLYWTEIDNKWYDFIENNLTNLSS